jgi:hypothetical protein
MHIRRQGLHRPFGLPGHLGQVTVDVGLGRLSIDRRLDQVVGLAQFQLQAIAVLHTAD